MLQRQFECMLSVGLFDHRSCTGALPAHNQFRFGQTVGAHPARPGKQVRRTRDGDPMSILASAGAATTASAHEKTRVEARQELIQAETHGVHVMSSDARRAETKTAVAAPSDCVGPVSFCTPYFSPAIGSSTLGEPIMKTFPCPPILAGARPRGWAAQG